MKNGQSLLKTSRWLLLKPFGHGGGGGGNPPEKRLVGVEVFFCLTKKKLALRTKYI